MKNEKVVKILILLGILGSVLVGIGEYLLHFLPEGPGGEVTMLEHVPLARASKGHFFAVFAAPLYFAGYYGLMEFFKKTSETLANMLLILGCFGIFYWWYMDFFQVFRSSSLTKKSGYSGLWVLSSIL